MVQYCIMLTKNKYFDCPAFASKVVDKVGAGRFNVVCYIYFVNDQNLKALSALFLGSLGRRFNGQLAKYLTKLQ